MDLPGETTYPPKKRPLSKQLSFCNSILREMNSKKHEAYAWPFYYPVDAEKLGLPDYHKVIKQPMDLQTIKVSLGCVRRSTLMSRVSAHFRVSTHPSFLLILCIYVILVRTNGFSM